MLKIKEKKYAKNQLSVLNIISKFQAREYSLEYRKAKQLYDSPFFLLLYISFIYKIVIYSIKLVARRITETWEYVGVARNNRKHTYIWLGNRVGGIAEKYNDTIDDCRVEPIQQRNHL